MTTDDTAGTADREQPLPLSPADSDDYSATVLASHWFQRPEPDTTPVAAPEDGTTPTLPTDGTVLRFGPGVTGTAPRRASAAAPPTRVPRRRRRRHALPALVLAAVLAFVFWRQHDDRPVTVRAITVTAVRETLGCDRTAHIVAVVRTDGPGGTLSYQWVRSDGTVSAVLRATVGPGREHTRLRLLWTFEGEGRHPAVAELRVLSPVQRSADVAFLYDCR
ncbi:hypothetical protein [Streptomyces sp. A012304]|uniref:hypothetical protein n=1 Tax=Streptomyces sp. A012304 TaxID=375446 RepID=UPI002231CF78|nr:hypothetical protein [Streptomyces sp. A012304]GKQ40514.1 hypothetical protein ALMP_70380 [Streptomyces sp. A012304]